MITSITGCLTGDLSEEGMLTGGISGIQDLEGSIDTVEKLTYLETATAGGGTTITIE